MRITASYFTFEELKEQIEKTFEDESFRNLALRGKYKAEWLKELLEGSYMVMENTLYCWLKDEFYAVPFELHQPSLGYGDELYLFDLHSFYILTEDELRDSIEKVQKRLKKLQNTYQTVH